MCEAVTEQPIALESVALKTCYKCHIAKPLTEFYVSRARPDGLQQACKECHTKSVTISAQKNQNRDNIESPEFKTCLICGIEKPSSQFSICKTIKDGLQNNCKECSRAKCKDTYDRNKVRDVVVVPDSKYCPCCKEILQSQSFGRLKSSTNGLRAHCKKCEAKLAKKYKYKVSLEWLEAMLAAQGGACAICKSRFTDDNRACVDHDHLTGKIRGFLCRRCNSAIGFFKDSSDLLRLAKSYILDSANNGITILFQPGWKSRVPLAIRELIFKRQGGLCKICLVDLLKIKKPCLDHDHLTGMVRGYLCDNCNSGLGYLEDLVELMESAAVYLDKNQEEIRG